MELMEYTGSVIVSLPPRLRPAAQRGGGRGGCRGGGFLQLLHLRVCRVKGALIPYLVHVMCTYVLYGREQPCILKGIYGCTGTVLHPKQTLYPSLPFHRPIDQKITSGSKIHENRADFSTVPTGGFSFQL